VAKFLQSNSYNNALQYSIRQGEPASVICGEYLAMPTASASWKRFITRNHFVSVSSDRAQPIPENALFFLDPKARDSGIYGCTVGNGFVSTTAFYYVQVTVTSEYSLLFIISNFVVS